MHDPPAPELPSWSREIVDLYESGAAAQFVLHGNVRDRFLLAGAEPRVVALEAFLKRRLLGSFDVVIAYDIGNGIRVEKGGERFAEWPGAKQETAFPTMPREAIHSLGHYLRFCANAGKLRPGFAPRVAVLVKNADLIAPPSPGGRDYELSAIASQLRDWASDPAITGQHCATFLLTENLNDLHPLVARNPQAATIAIPLPGAAEIAAALAHWNEVYPAALRGFHGEFAAPAAALAGATLHSIETLLRSRQHQGRALTPEDLAALKKELVENDAGGLIEFLQPAATLDDFHGQAALKEWLRQDFALWHAGDVAALPMGYLLCGPVGTGKTFLVDCLAGEAGVPVVRLRNFRDRWVGSTEGNLEKIFRLLDALGRCIVFVDEADQTLGRRSSGAGDSGVSGRIYGMMAAKMSDPAMRGRVLWVLATSRPDLVEVDLKRPGRIDVKIPLFPTATADEGYQLLRALAGRRGVELAETLPDALAAQIPELLTPGAAEAIAVRLYRSRRTGGSDPAATLAEVLGAYQPPVAMEVIRAQIALARDEATDLQFVPPQFRNA